MLVLELITQELAGLQIAALKLAKESFASYSSGYCRADRPGSGNVFNVESYELARLFLESCGR